MLHDYYARQREAAARRTLRLMEFRQLCMSSCAKPEQPDYAGCTNADEVAVVKLGGSLETYRVLLGDDEAAAEVALASFAAGTGVKLAPRAKEHTAAPVRMSPEDEIEAETRAVLIKLGIDPDYATIKDSNDLAARRKAKAAK